MLHPTIFEVTAYSLEWYINFFTEMKISWLSNYCNTTCKDGKKNQGELQTDCGGPCDECRESNGEKIKARMENIIDTTTKRAKEQTTPIAQTIVTADSAQVTTTSNRILTSPKEIQAIKGTTRSNTLVYERNNPKDQVVGEINAAWFKEYLLKEQQLNLERQEERMKQQEEMIKQQEALLNITQTLLQNMKKLP